MVFFGNIFRNKRLQIILPAAQVLPEVLGSLHDFCIAGHLGAKKTLEKVCVHFYWPGQKKEVDMQTALCVTQGSSTVAAQLGRMTLAKNRHGYRWTFACNPTR